MWIKRFLAEFLQHPLNVERTLKRDIEGNRAVPSQCSRCQDSPKPTVNFHIVDSSSDSFMSCEETI